MYRYSRSIDSRLVRRTVIVCCGLMVCLLVGPLTLQVSDELVLALLLGSLSLFFLAARPLWMVIILALYIPFYLSV